MIHHLPDYCCLALPWYIHFSCTVLYCGLNAKYPPSISKRANSIVIIIKGEVQHFFLTGRKDMGKTSIAEFIIKYVTRKYNMTYDYVSNKGNDSVDKLASNIMKELLEKVPQKRFDEKLNSWFGKHVTEIQIMGTKINFNIDREKENNIKENFPKY